MAVSGLSLDLRFVQAGKSVSDDTVGVTALRGGRWVSAGECLAFYHHCQKKEKRSLMEARNINSALPH